MGEERQFEPNHTRFTAASRLMSTFNSIPVEPRAVDILCNEVCSGWSEEVGRTSSNSEFSIHSGPRPTQSPAALTGYIMDSSSSLQLTNHPSGGPPPDLLETNQHIFCPCYAPPIGSLETGLVVLVLQNQNRLQEDGNMKLYNCDSSWWFCRAGVCRMSRSYLSLNSQQSIKFFCSAHRHEEQNLLLQQRQCHPSCRRPQRGINLSALIERRLLFSIKVTYCI